MIFPTTVMKEMGGVLFISGATALASPDILFSLGENNNSTSEFSQESFTLENAPGSATERDDHYYLAGTYPPPIGVLAADEDLDHFERALTSGDPRIVVHFNLDAGQATNTGLIFFTVEFLWSGASINGQSAPANNIVELSVNGKPASFVSQEFENYTTFSGSFSTAGLDLVDGPNQIELRRTGVTSGSWVAIDRFEASIDPRALEDADGDQLPRYWEITNLLSDDDPTDAGIDLDHDSLTNLEEFQSGTNPRYFDTDRDGLSDGEETDSSPLDPDTDKDGIPDGEETNSSPSLVDTDSDGASDGWEISTGYDPNDDQSTPPNWNGAISINFRSEARSQQGIWPDSYPNGYVPQIHWNQTDLLESSGVSSGDPLRPGDTSDIASPVAGTVVDSAGQPTGMTVSFTFDGTRTTRVYSTDAAGIFNGYLSADTNTPAILQIDNIPASFATYDVYVYLSSSYFDPVASIRRDGSFLNQVFLRPISSGAELGFEIFRPTTGPVAPRANVVHFKGLTNRSVLLEAFRVDDTSSGIAAVQIINTSADANGNSIPDWWELKYKMGASTSPDPDGDTLTWLEEFQIGSDPWSSDTDGDGLADDEEQVAGTDPTFPDSDDDGLSDYDELNHPLASDPTLADTDNDGLSDGEERASGSDPADATMVGLPVPVFPGPGELLWKVDNLQFVIDHGEGVRSDGGTNRDFIELEVDSITAERSSELRFRLYRREGRITYNFYARGSGSFNNNGNSFSRTENSADLTSALGLAGFGSADTTDPLTFQVRGLQDPLEPAHWTVTYSIINQRTSTTVAEYAFTERSAADFVVNQTGVWGIDNVEGISGLDLTHGVSAFRTTTPVDQLPGLAALADRDNDGMSDLFEIENGLNLDDPSDAGLDPDNDGLDNLSEFFIGSLPGNPDTDGDGVPDGLEAAQFTDPTSAASRPPFYLTGPPAGNDLNGNGLSDVWESRYGAFALDPNGDEDGDGYSNLDEERIGSDPLDPNSRFQVLSHKSLTPEAVDFTFPRLTYKNLSVLTSPTLDNFQPANLTLQPEGSDYRVTLPTDSNSTFLRVGIKDIDSDLDGLSDWEESVLGSTSTSGESIARSVAYDSDGDGEVDGMISGDRAMFFERFGPSVPSPGGVPGPAPNRTEAARLLMQATFGPTMSDIEVVRRMGLEPWINDQIDNQPPTHHEDYILQIQQDLNGPHLDKTYRTSGDDEIVSDENLDSAFARAAVSAPDQLRQRVAFALSQILVISRQDGAIDQNTRALARYYDRLVDHAFGNYYDLLMGVTLDANMGRYLSHAGNLPPAPEINRFPDENYAREVMQLFSIGLWELKPDGTRKLDQSGNPIPTYGNETITELARVMTGLWFSNNGWGSQTGQDEEHLAPMEIFPDYHDFGEKTLLNGFVIPAREPSVDNGLQDVRDAIRHLVEHPSCAPFVSKGLIQFLVTGNPSPAYVARVSAVFADNGQGERGDLAAVVKAILMDVEARDPVIANSPDYGILREPVIRTMHLARLTKLNRSRKMVWWDYGDYYEDMLQSPLYSPTVFNFYRPDYSPPGALDQSSLSGPAFQIANSYTTISLPNRLWDIADRGFRLSGRYHFPPDYGDFMTYLGDNETLLDYLNLVICAGRMKASTRSLLITHLDQAEFSDPVEKARLAVYLTLMSPEGSVQR